MQERPKRSPIFFAPWVALVREPLWRPSADIYRSTDEWILEFDLAGVRPDQIRVEVDGRRLTVRGSRRDTLQSGDCCPWSMEISYSSFERSVELPVSLDEARVECEYKDGMFLIRVRAKETHDAR
jgi:HSP20 family protein